MRNQFVFLIMNFLRSLSNVSASLDILFVDYDRELYYCDRLYTNLLHIISGMSLTLEVVNKLQSCKILCRIWYFLFLVLQIIT